MMKFYHWCPLALLLLFSSFLSAQTSYEHGIDYIEKNVDQWGLSLEDVKEMRLQDMYTDAHNGLTHIYLVQQYQGIDVHNAMINISMKEDNTPLVAFSRFQSNLTSKINTTQAVISPEKAVENFVSLLEVEFDVLKKVDEPNGAIRYQQTSFSNTDILVRPVYQVEGEGVRLAWNIEFDQAKSVDYWSVRMDAVTGELLDKHNYTVSCSYGEGHAHGSECDAHVSDVVEVEEEEVLLTTPLSYAVFALPAESPIHGPRVVVTAPWDADASPFGWHDVNGVDDGPDFTITRGNNVHAYADENATNSPSQPEPEGGDDLEFDDFNYDGNLEPAEMHDAAITNLFYMNNMIHDFLYCYGFDEQSGNFQSNNYGNGGQGSDEVNAEGLDGSGVNNANFATPPDGQNPRMQMFLWGATSGIFFLDAPEDVAGPYSVGTAEFGAVIGPVAVTGDIAYYRDNSQNPTHGCEEINANSNVNGKVALIDRGSCFFSDKAVMAQDAGAIGVIICNFEDNTINMADGGNGGGVTIPIVMLSSSDCATIKMLMDDGTNVVARYQDEPGNGPDLLAGSYDNGIIAHEYGHGLSNRLTGGPNNTGCLSNDEQMGEGWSDFLGLIMTVEPGDEGTDSRGIGTYALSQGVGGGGIRDYPYSTDMDIYPQTYEDVIGSGPAPHPLGEIWAATLWDLYWKMVETYGYSEDCNERSAGNNLAIQLVIDGMKLQPCSPGMLDGRDAIIAADEANNAGQNFCLIWEVFARRGMGFYADQGSAFDRDDAVEDFTPFPPCLDKILLTKEAVEVVEAGDNVDVTLTATNYKFDEVTNVTIVEEVPEGTSVVPGSISDDGVLEDDKITWNIGTLVVEEMKTVSYTIATPSSQTSAIIWLDDFESGDGNWLPDLPSNQGPNIHFVVNDNVHSGTKAIQYVDLDNASDAAIYTIESYSLDVDNPTMRFWQQHTTETGADGGLVEISRDGGMVWEIIDVNETFRNGYTGPLAYQTLVLPFLEAWSGTSDGWIDSWIDLSDFAGEDVHIRMRFGTSDATGTLGGWWFDDIELMDLLAYQSEACVTSDQGDNECVSLDGKGILVESDFVSATEDELSGVEYNIFPNPANDEINVSITSDKTEDAEFSLQTLNGQAIKLVDGQLTTQNQIISLNVADVIPGMYIVKIQTKSGQITEKVIIQK